MLKQQWLLWFLLMLPSTLLRLLLLLPTTIASASSSYCYSYYYNSNRQCCGNNNNDNDNNTISNNNGDKQIMVTMNTNSSYFFSRNSGNLKNVAWQWLGAQLYRVSQNIYQLSPTTNTGPQKTYNKMPTDELFYIHTQGIKCWNLRLLVASGEKIHSCRYVKYTETNDWMEEADN